jgi:uncharacterized damage-inducible protein DinB
MIIAVAIEQPDKISEKANSLLNHVLNAQQIWNSRLLGTPAVGVFDLRTVTELKAMNDQNFEEAKRIVADFDFEKHITYTNTKGEIFSNSVRDILFHVINHSTYHRAQIATEFKNAGIAPAVTDYIFFKREKK